MSTRIPTVNDLRVKLCYICREEERYDARQEHHPREWTHPCRCTLIAHESCLLKWIQTSQSSSSRAPNALKCPQCGSYYELESKESVILQLLSAGNKTLQKLGRLFTAISAASIVGVVGAGVYVVLTGYGAWAVNQFIGKELYDKLLSDDPTHWPWTAYFNLPMLPISLILSRFQTGSQIPPIVPILLAWPPSIPANERNRLLSEYWLQPDNTRRLSEDFPTRPWPPSPVVFGILIIPVVRIVYRGLYNKLYLKVMGVPPIPPRGGQQLGLQINEGAFMIRIRANVQQDGGAAEIPQPEPELEPMQPQDVAEGIQDPEAAAVAAAQQLIEINTISLGRRLGGALLIPAISNFMGSLLYRLSKHSGLLRRFLGIRYYGVHHTALEPYLGPLLQASEYKGLSLWRQMGLIIKLGLTTFWGGTRIWAESDPVWWRNSIGLGIFIVAKDCVHLLHLYLAKRELESRRVKNRDFEGVDMRELDLIPTFPRS